MTNLRLKWDPLPTIDVSRISSVRKDDEKDKYGYGSRFKCSDVFLTVRTDENYCLGQVFKLCT